MIVIPAAGQGRRFKEAGYEGPKHLIPLAGRPMIEWVIENLLLLDPTQSEVVVATEYLIGKTKGAVDTLRRSLRDFSPKIDEPLIVANCDQLIMVPPIPAASAQGIGIGNGMIYTFKSTNPAHSYVRTNDNGRILDIVEKPEVVDPTWRAVSGVYVFPSPISVGQYIMTHDDSVIGTDANGPEPEQFFSFVLRRMIVDGFAFYAEETPTAILGTPEDFQRFETAASIIMAQEGRLSVLFEELES